VQDSPVRALIRADIPAMLAHVLFNLRDIETGGRAEKCKRAATALLNFASRMVHQCRRRASLRDPEEYVVEAIEKCHAHIDSHPHGFTVGYVARTTRNLVLSDLRISRNVTPRELGDLENETFKQGQFQEPDIDRATELESRRLIDVLIEEIKTNQKRYPKRFAEYVRLLAQDEDGRLLTIADESGEWVFHPEEIAEALGVSVSTAHRLRAHLVDLRTVIRRLLDNE
jgi:DNA-directed RNA polymerase specialized sigma24 family protein